MKRVRDPLGRVSSPNSGSARTPSGTQSKHPRQQHQQNGEALRQELGPFRALLATCGVVWRSADRGATNEARADADDRKSLGFPCRCNPSKLRLGVEKALVHDPARRQEFVEVRVGFGLLVLESSCSGYSYYYHTTVLLYYRLL